MYNDWSAKIIYALQDVASLVDQHHGKISSQSQDFIAQRQPLVRKAAARVADVRQYNPQFEEEFVAGKDYDPDRLACFLLVLAAPMITIKRHCFTIWKARFLVACNCTPFQRISRSSQSILQEGLWHVNCDTDTAVATFMSFHAGKSALHKHTCHLQGVFVQTLCNAILCSL